MRNILRDRIASMKLHMNALQQLGAESQEQLPGSSTKQIDYSAFWARACVPLTNLTHSLSVSQPGALPESARARATPRGGHLINLSTTPHRRAIRGLICGEKGVRPAVTQLDPQDPDGGEGVSSSVFCYAVSRF